MPKRYVREEEEYPRYDLFESTPQGYSTPIDLTDEELAEYERVAYHYERVKDMIAAKIAAAGGGD